MGSSKNYKVLTQEVYCHHFLLFSDFEYKGKKYLVKSHYYDGGWGFENTEVLDENEDCVNDNEIVSIANDIICDMDIENYKVRS